MIQVVSSIKSYLVLRLRVTAFSFIVFYGVGASGILIPATRQIFISLVPFALLLSAVGLWLFHSFPLSGKSLLTLGLIYILGLSVEIAGVRTGVIFGPYHYGETLGPKILQTPLLIGLNWLMLSYCFADVAQRISPSPAIRIGLASVGMVVYDLILEQVAPALDMWHWAGGTVPMRNYMAWFVISMLFTVLLSRIKIHNPLAVIILICQITFFLALAIFL